MSEPEPSVFFIGDVSEDAYFSADRWPAIADKGYVTALRSYVGGMIANAACVYAGLGGRPEFISLLNEGPLSSHLCATLTVLGVSTRHMLRDPGMGDSRNLIFLVEGEHVVLTVDIGRAPMQLADAATTALRSPGYLYTTLNRAKRLRAGSLAGAALLADLRHCGRRLIFDLDVEGFEAADLELLRGAEVLIMNQVGFQRSFGTVDASAIHQFMSDREVRTIVRTLAADGAEVFHANQVLRRPAYRVPVVDVTGGGDTFGGALVFGLTRSLDLEVAIDLAIAAASRAVTIEGPQGGVASLQTIMAFKVEHSDLAAEAFAAAPPTSTSAEEHRHPTADGTTGMCGCFTDG